MSITAAMTRIYAINSSGLIFLDRIFMLTQIRLFPVVGVVGATLMLAGCNATAPKNDTEQPSRVSSTQTSKSSKPQVKEATTSNSNERKVVGRNGWEGTIVGSPFKGSKFTRLEIGMSYKQVVDLVGPPTDQYSHITGKAWIPFYFGSGRTESKLLYKGQGKLAFSGDGGISTGSHLTYIEYNSRESGYKQ